MCLVRLFATSDCPTVATLSENLFMANGLDVAEDMKRLKSRCHDVFDEYNRVTMVQKCLGRDEH